MSIRIQTRHGFRVLLTKYNPSDFDEGRLQKRLIDHQRFLMHKRQQALSADDAGLDMLEEDRRERVPSHVLSRINRRVETYQQRKQALTGLDHLKSNERQILRGLVHGVNASYVNEASADSLAAQMHIRFPWLAQATETVWLQLRRAAAEGLPARIGPILLDGPPGIGKSAWARELASALQAPHLTIDAVAASTGFAAAGTERGWSSAQPGRPIQAILQHHHAGPIVVVDEVCKAAASTSNQGTRHSIQDALLGLLEPVSAAAWSCPFYRVNFNLSAVSWILTSNRIDQVPPPLLSRCDVIRCDNLSTKQLLNVAAKMSEKIGLCEPAKEAVSLTVEQSCAVLTRPTDLRDVRRIVEKGLSLQTKPFLN